LVLFKKLSIFVYFVLYKYLKYLLWDDFFTENQKNTVYYLLFYKKYIAKKRYGIERAKDKNMFHLVTFIITNPFL